MALDAAGSAAPRRLRAPGTAARALALDPRGSWLAVGCADGTIDRIALAGTGQLAPLRAGSPVRRMVVDGAGRWLVAVTDGFTCEVFAAGSGERVHVLGDATLRIHDADVSADGRRLATLDAGHAQIWDLASGVSLLRVLAGSASDSNVAFRADGRGLRAAGVRARAWDVEADAQTAAKRAAVRVAYDAHARLRERWLVASEILRRADEERLPDAARAELERLVGRIGDSVTDLNELAWATAIRANETPAAYGRALTAAARAAELAPANASVLNTLATVCYRAGQHARAAELTARLIADSRSGKQAPSPFDLAVRAMALWRLGRGKEGMAALEELRAQARAEGQQLDVQAVGFLREAEELLRSR